MKKYLSFVPFLLLGITGATVTADWVITLPDSLYSSVWDKLLNLWLSFLNMTAWFLPTLLIFWVLIGLGIFVFNKVTHSK